MTNSVKERAESLELLTPRLEINQRCQDRDFQSWLQSRLNVQAGETVLDLACGDGAQSKLFDKRIGLSGSLKCVDIHAPSINSLRQHITPGANRLFCIANMMDFDSYIGAEKYSLVHCSFALPYAANPGEVIKKLSEAVIKPLGRLAIALPCNPHDMVQFIQGFHDIPATVQPAINLGESLGIDIFRQLFGEVDVSYFNSKLTFCSAEDFMNLYRCTTYYSEAHDSTIEEAVSEAIKAKGKLTFKKSAILLIGRDPR